MRKKSVTKKRSLTFRLLYYSGKLIGLNTLTLSANNELKFSYFSLFYASFLITTYSYVFYYALIERMNMTLLGETVIGVIVHFIAMCSSFLGTTSAWFIFAFYQNRAMSIVKSFVRAETISRKLGIPTNYEKHYRKLGIDVAIAVTAHLFYTIVSNVAIMHRPDFHIFIWTCYIFTRVTLLLTWTIFTWSLRIVRHKFQRLNEKVNFLMRNDYVERRRMDNIVASESSRSLRCNSVRFLDGVKLIFRLHRELRDVTYRIEQHFGVFMLIDVNTQFMLLAFSVYNNYCMLKAQQFEDMDFMYVVSLCCWCLFPIVLLTLISNVCGSTLSEANRTGQIIHAMLDNFDHFGDTEETARLNVLSLHLLHNKLRISALGFFYLDDALIYNTIAIATTYLTIMLQF